jgi:hypothetical protein
MKSFKSLLAASLMLAALALTGCDLETTSKNSVTVNGLTYENVDAYYWLDGGFNVRIVLSGDRLTTGFGMVDARKAMDHTWTIDEEFGWGDRLFLQVTYPDGTFYTATPVSGTQTIMKAGEGLYNIQMDTVDEEGKPFKMNVTAKAEQGVLK